MNMITNKIIHIIRLVNYLSVTLALQNRYLRKKAFKQSIQPIATLRLIFSLSKNEVKNVYCNIC